MHSASPGNQASRTPPSEFIDSLLVSEGMNVADRRIVESAEPGDQVITADIPLAAEVVANPVEVGSTFPGVSGAY